MTSTQSNAVSSPPLIDRRRRNGPVHHDPARSSSTLGTVDCDTTAAHRHQLVATVGNPYADVQLMFVACDPTTVSDLRRKLREWGYQRFRTSENPSEAFTLLQQEPPDLLIVDAMSTAASGLRLLADIRRDSTCIELPVLMLVSATATATRHRAVELGATDLLTKPIDSAELALRVRNILNLAQVQARLTMIEAEAEDRLQQRTTTLVASRKEVLQCLARAGEYRDHGTGKHVLRVSQYAGAIARELGLCESHVECIEEAAMLHDIGKIGVSDYILLKPNRLTEAEFNVIKQHCQFGRDILQPDRESDFGGSPPGLGSIAAVDSSRVMQLAANIAMTHHEWWNGQGYPRGLAGEAIPLEGRITAVADVYDALSSRRPYKPAYPRKHCLTILQRGRGQQFDPCVLDAFFAAQPAIVEIQRRLADATATPFFCDPPDGPTDSTPSKSGPWLAEGEVPPVTQASL